MVPLKGEPWGRELGSPKDLRCLPLPRMFVPREGEGRVGPPTANFGRLVDTLSRRRPKSGHAKTR